MLRVLLVATMLIPQLAFADTSSGTVNASVTITNIPQPIVRLNGSRFTQGAASITVSRAGFNDIQSLGQAGPNYYFSGVRNGRLYEIAVAQANGRIMSVTVV